MLRSTASTSLFALVLASMLVGCSEGTETGDDSMSATSDDDSSDDDSSDDDSSDDDSGDDDSGDDDSSDDDSGDDDSGDDDSGDDDSGDDDSTPAPAEEEVLIDPTIDPFMFLDYATEKEFLNEDATIESDAAVGDPAPSLRFEIPFTNYNQFIEFEFLADQVNGGIPWDLTGKVITLNLRVEDTGFTNMDCPGGVRFYIKTGVDYAYGGRSWLSTPAASPSFQGYDFDVEFAELGSGVTALDLADVRSIGLAFESADCGAMFLPGDPPPEMDPPTTAIFYLEDITVRDKDG